MLITNSNLEALRTGFKADFKKGLGTGTSKYALITTPVTSTTKVNTYGFLGDLPIFRKWIGEKRVKSLEEKAYTLSNEDFEATIGIHKNKIRDDNLGLYSPLVQGWGQEAGALKDRLVFAALAAGHQRACYDGQNFFDTDHPVTTADGATQSVANVSAGGASQPWYLLDCSKPLKPILLQTRQEPTFEMVTDEADSHVFKTGEFLMGGEARAAAGYTFWQLAYKSTQPLTEANYEAAKTAMAALTNDEGEPLGIRPTHIVVGTSNFAAARELFLAQNKAGGASNIYFKDVEIVEADRLP